jgi:hypothetical protein
MSEQFPDGSEYAVVETVPTRMGQYSSFNYSAGVSHDEAKSKGWNVITLKNDWKSIFEFEQ